MSKRGSFLVEASLEARKQTYTDRSVAWLGDSSLNVIIATFSVSLIPVWAFFGGVVYAVGVYWLGGGLLYGAARRFGGLGTYRRARHLLTLSAMPLALALFTLWPIRIAVYGQDLFRTGGNDYGPGDRAFGGLLYFAFAWSAVLLVIGVRSVHGWSWGRSLATVGLAAALPALLVFATAA